MRLHQSLRSLAVSDMTSDFANCAGYEIHFTQWGHAHPTTIVMWHGLARTGRDFDAAAEHLSQRYRVLCPDTIGRGLSQWASDEHDYGLDTYAQIATELLDALDIKRVRWLGTSMGGALGIKLAAGVLKERITHLVLNDFGPEPAVTSVERIIDYVSHPPVFNSVAELEAYLRIVYAPFGYQTDPQWRTMAETSLRRTDDGRVTLHYDPALIQQLTHHPTDYLLWDEYDRVTCPTLLLRGENSDLLSPEVAQRMTVRGPKCRWIDIPGCGHAPALNVAAQWQHLDAFFEFEGSQA